MLRIAPVRFQTTFAALRHRNYRLWFTGQLVSLVGTWMQSVAQGYLVYDLTKSAAYLGYVGFANGLPSWLFMAYGGVIADRIPRRTMLIITQSVMMLLAILMAVLIFTELIQPWHVVAMAFLLGVTNAFDTPARQSFAAELVAREDLTNAIALNATMFNGGAVVGPAVAGLVYAAVGPGWCFMLNGISFVAVLIALAMQRLPPFVRKLSGMSAFNELKEGLQYVRAHQSIMLLILTAGFVSMFGMAPITLLPAWSVNILQGDVTTNGLLVSSRGVGGVLGALMLASLGGNRQARSKFVRIGVVLLPIMFIVFSFLRIIPAAMVLLAMIGFSFMMVVNSCNALVQSSLPDHFRGRVMGIYSLTFMGAFPLGALFAGQLAQRWGEPAAVVVCASILLVYSSLLLIKRPQLLTED